MQVIECGNRDKLYQYLVGKVWASKGESLDLHILSCMVCQATLASLDDNNDKLVRLLRQLAKPK